MISNFFNTAVRFFASFCLLITVCTLFFIEFSFVSKSFQKNVASDSTCRPAVIIDAGHGGMDGGAVAADGTAEKVFNLDLAQKLRSFFLMEGYDVIMTRVSDDDTDGQSNNFDKKTDIRNRKALSDNYPGVLFLSIHINLSTSARDKGFQIFFGSQNALSKTYADSIHRYAQQSGICNRVRDIAVAPQKIFLMQNIVSPCALIECCFISNPDDYALIISDMYREKIMMTVFSGVISAQVSQRQTQEIPSE